MLNLITININGDICQKRPGRGKRSRLMHVWYPNTRKLFTIAKKCIELDLCIRIRCTTLYIVLVSLWSILTKIFAKNMYFTCLLLTIFEQPCMSHFLYKTKSCISKNRPCQGMSCGILLDSIGHHWQRSQRVEITPHSKRLHFWTPFIPLKKGFTTSFTLYKKLDNYL